ncbi:MAG: adenylate/guanylate cyclase domain-containing protein [Geminicoccaceae bacterium]
MASHPATDTLAPESGGTQRWWQHVSQLVLGPPLPRAVPERVLHTIRAQEEESEILVGWVQVCAIITFAILYHLTPKAFPSTVPFEPVPVVLALYSLFTGFRLLLAYRRALTPAILTVSVLVDMGLLMITIWSFHLQYGEPPAMYIKAPTLMYAFILIALRALRFEARYVLLAGMTASVFWFVLVLYALVWTPGNIVPSKEHVVWVMDCARLKDDMEGCNITKRYDEYMTSYKVLLGAELDKILSLMIVTSVLAIAIIRARKLLVISASERIASAELARFFDPSVAEQIRSSDHSIAAGEGIMREAAVMFVDMRAFTQMSAGLDPAATIELLSDYQATVVPVIARHGGNIDKYLGDGILASFGAAQDSPAYAADALRALDDVLDAVDAWSLVRQRAGRPPVRVGVAVTVGQVLFGATGFGDRLEYTVLGDTVNTAAKLEKHTKVERVRALTTRAAFEAAKRQGYVPTSKARPMRARQIAGIVAAQDLIALG